MIAPSLIVLAVALAGTRPAGAPPSADAIMRENFYATKIPSLSSESTMLLIDKRGTVRKRILSSWTRLQEDGIDEDVAVRFDSPPDVAGTKFLQIQHRDRDDDMWIYLPALHRSRRIVASNKRDSFVGTDFSYADILPLDPANFRNRFLREEQVDGVACYVIESVAKDPQYARDLGYGRRVLWIRKDDFVEARVNYYGETDQLLKTQTTLEHLLIQTAPRRTLVRRREMVDRESGHRTVFTVENFDSKKVIGRWRFTVEALETP